MAWANGTGSWSTSANVTIQFGFGYAPPPPTCHKCANASEVHTADGRLWCKPCVEAENLRLVIAQAENWLGAIFVAVKRENHARAYKALAALFHPDQGGDERVMIALNRVRDQFR